jgi:amino-acid N-acetyltransferase
MNLRSAIKTDLEVINELLNASNLPSSDIEEHLEGFMVYEEEEKIIAIGGFEKHGNDALVRSITTEPRSQGKGIGKSIYKSIEHNARSLGVTTLYLLTETAEEFFKKLGFSVKDRTGIPESIIKSKQYSLLCPSTATLMCKQLSVLHEKKQP